MAKKTAIGLKTALFVKMAARNILKYRRRSLQSAAAIFLGVFFVMLAGAFISGMSADMITNFITMEGHAVVRTSGYAERREMMPLDRLIPRSEEARKAFRSEAPRVNAFASLFAPGLVSKGGKPGEEPDAPGVSESQSAVVLCAGVMPFDEGAFNPALDDVRKKLTAGRFFQGSSDRGMVLSGKAASTIGVSPGDTVIFLCSDKYDSFNMIELPLLGVFRMDEYSAEFSCVMDLPSMQVVTGVEDEAAQIAVYAMDREGVPTPPSQAEGAVHAAASKAVGLGLELEPWNDASKSTAAIMGFLDASMAIMYVMFAVVAVVGITNSILLSVQDRIRDFGTLRAISFTGSGVTAIIAVEATLLGMAASLLGAFLAWGISAYFQLHGIPLPHNIGAIQPGLYPQVIRPVMEPGRLLAGIVVGTLVPLLAALPPMLMVKKMSIREALAFL